MDTRTTIVDSLSLHASFEANQEAVQEVGQKETEAIAPDDPLTQARMLAAFNNAIGQLKDEDKGPGVMSSAQNAVASRLQSMMVEAALGGEGGETFGLKLKQAMDTLEVKFDNFDWIGWIPVGLKKAFPPKPFPFRDPHPAAEPVADKLRVAVFGDWGSGLYGAQPIATAIKSDPNYQLVLHLGDTYYSGTKKEFQSRFTAFFPKPAGAVARSLNGNHEMYSGGIPYIEAIDQDFDQKSSCFAWQTDHWLLVGLDTAYWDDSTPAKDHVLTQRQFDWLNGLLAAAGSRKVVLFSHHQLFSQLSDQGTHLIDKLEPLLESGRIHSWYWGHEHRCVVYEPHPLWGLRGRCIGHGGFPEFRNALGTAVQGELGWTTLAAKEKDGVKVPAAQSLEGPNRFINDGPARYLPHGFLTLEFDGPNLVEIYREPDGTVLPNP